MNIDADNLNDLKIKILNAIQHDGLDDESNIILDKLYKINQLGLITVESQPYHFRNVEDMYFLVKRAFLNGLYPHNLVNYFVQELLKINPNIMVVETILNPKGEKYDTLKLWNITSKDYDIVIDGSYPLGKQIFKNGIVKYFNGFTGNLEGPADRDDFMENYSDYLVQELYDNNYSHLEIFSRDIDDELFDDIIGALQNMQL